MKNIILILFIASFSSLHSQNELSKNRICNCEYIEKIGIQSDLGLMIPQGYSGCVIFEENEYLFEYAIYSNGQELERVEYGSGKLLSYSTPFLFEHYDSLGRIEEKIIFLKDTVVKEYHYIVDEKGHHYLNFILDFDENGNLENCTGKGCKAYLKKI